MIEKLQNQTAIVTGGCRGIGKAIVERFAREGATAFALDYSVPDSIEEMIEDESLRGKITMIKCDVTNSDSVNNAFKQVTEETGRLDILVNNAGITRDGLMLRMSEKNWDDVINTNLKGAFLCLKAAIMPMMKQRSGRIINIGSIIGVTGNAGQANYASSKAGLMGLTKSMAKELASRNILVNCIAPGFVLTPMTEEGLTEEQKNSYVEAIPLKKGAKPEDIANVVSFFAGEDSSYVTGQVLNVDGGLVT